MIIQNLNSDVTQFLDAQQHPLRPVIERLRELILGAYPGITENFKWNGPNYCYSNQDRITIKIHPPKQLQVILHRGAKVKAQPAERLIPDASGLLTWKGNDRAIASFRNEAEKKMNAIAFQMIVHDWILACSV